LPTVFGEIDSRRAISLFESPRASSRNTSTSRGVSPAGPSRRLTTRWPAAAFFAMQQGLLPEEEFPAVVAA
jgi:hypothetical protein